MVTLKDKGNFQSTPRDPIIEAAARALQHHSYGGFDDKDARELARRTLAAVAPLIRAQALEEAAQVAEDVDRDVAKNSASWSLGYFAQHIRGTAAAIRALKEQLARFAPEGRHWRHVTSGMFVTEIGRGRMQTAEPIGDMTPIVIYHHAGEHGVGGTFWVRPVREFEDGRFVAFIAEP
jgi:hypothetical protein